MIQGCGSDVGKSILVAGLCRLFSNRGLRVLPFKPQNMSNNAAVTRDGGEIGRAQALQALACRAAFERDMNPVLLKPEADRQAQLILRGRVAGRVSAQSYQQRKGDLIALVLESYRRLEARADLVLIEGAGSPAEINLRPHDIANMGFARAAEIPVVLVGDIDRGHVIASLIGAAAVLEAADAALIKGFIINKFRGDPQLFDSGRRIIAERTGWFDLGLVPWLDSAAMLPAEDALDLDRRRSAGRPNIAVPILPHIANFDDFDPLKADPELTIEFISRGRALPGSADLVIIPGTKSTRADLAAFKTEGWDIDLKAHLRRGGRVLGLCGGFQMLGRRILDSEGVEGEAGFSEGLNFLDVETILTNGKTLRAVSGALAEGGARFTGFEMHLGVTTGADMKRPFALLDQLGSEGARSPDGRISGTYIHGLFDSGALRAALMNGSRGDHGPRVDQALDELAAALAQNLDIDRLEQMAWRR